MTVPAQAITDAAKALLGIPYGTDNPQRYTLGSGEADCSGWFYEVLESVGIYAGGVLSGSEAAWAVTNGGEWVDAEFAINNPGVGCLIGGTGGVGPSAHIGLSAGDGEQCLESPSAEGHQSGLSPFWREPWEQFFTIPGVDYTGNPPGPPTPADGVGSIDLPTVQEGSTGQEVRGLQALIGVAADGEFGPITEAAVRQFQSAASIGVDGVVGPETWTALVQRAVGAAIDGQYGPETTAKVEAYQQANGLDVDGVVGPLTLAKLSGQ